MSREGNYTQVKRLVHFHVKVRHRNAHLSTVHQQFYDIRGLANNALESNDTTFIDFKSTVYGPFQSM